MKKELEEELVKKYPKILELRSKGNSIGVTLGNGWYNLLDNLMSFLQFHTDRNNYSQVIASQIKEKFGLLSFYVEEVAGQYLRGAISFAESLSSSICEHCGSNVNVKRRSGGWIRHLCDTCNQREGECNEEDSC